MKSTEGTIGRVFIIRLEDGDRIPDCLERFAQDHKISHGQLILLGGIDGGQVVVGPRNSQQMPPEPMLLPVDGSHEVAGVGLLVPGADGKPNLHIHASLGRSGQSMTGCLRPGVDTWLIGEVILYELVGVNAQRILDKKSGFTLLEPGVENR